MLSEIKNLISTGQINKNQLLEILQKYAMKISIADYIHYNLLLRQDAKSIHTSYNVDFIKSYTIFFLRIKDVKQDKLKHVGLVDVNKLNDAVTLLLEQERTKKFKSEKTSFWSVYMIISLYTTFIKEEPIHQVGFLFPGGLKVKKKKDTFVCPVKENNQDNFRAVCPFCIAEQDEDV